MKQLLQDNKDGKMSVQNVPSPILRNGGVLVRTHYSVVSAGTERMLVDFARQSLVGKARARPDLVRQLVRKARTDGLLTTYKAAMERLSEPAALGYSCSGEIIEVGAHVDGLALGDRVACAGAGYACHAEINYIPANLVVHVPAGVSLRDASFVALGAIALQGVRRARLTPGECVAVIGLGLLGQITVQLLRAYGFPVMGIDVDPQRIESAQAFGLAASSQAAAANVERVAMEFSYGQGIDAVIITAATSGNGPVELAARLCRDRGRISVVGAVGMDLPRPPFYAKEIDLHVSRSYGPGRYDPTYEERGIDYPIGYVRWTENRNMQEFLRLIEDGRVRIDSLVDRVFEIEDALSAYELIIDSEEAKAVRGIVLRYPQTVEVKPTASSVVSITSRNTAKAASVVVGVIGAGNFARAHILPHLRKMKGVEIRGVATASGRTAAAVARRYHCAYSTSDYREILDDERINLIIIATRHDLHARLAIEALEKGKNVHLEKPMALTLSELCDVVAAERESEGRLHVGFNRRFASSALRIKSRLSSRTAPLTMQYRINAGSIPAENWVNDPQQGGGRIISEVCHFVDFLHFLAGSPPTRVFAASAGGAQASDNVSVSIEFANGSVGSILYTSLGDNSLGKERVEVFVEGRAFVIDNFKTGGHFAISQDKGHARILTSFVDAIRSGSPLPLPIAEAVLSTLTTFKIEEALRLGLPVAIDPTEAGLVP